MKIISSYLSGDIISIAPIKEECDDFISAKILLDISKDLKESQEKLHELGVPREDDFIYPDLQKAILNKLSKNELISHVLKFLIDNETMNQSDYEIIRIDLNMKTKWKSGNHGVLHSLTYSDHSWMSKYQAKYGDIIEINKDKLISLSEIWRLNSPVSTK